MLLPENLPQWKLLSSVLRLKPDCIDSLLSPWSTRKVWLDPPRDKWGIQGQHYNMYLIRNRLATILPELLGFICTVWMVVQAAPSEVFLDGHGALTLNASMTIFQRTRTTLAFRTCQGGGRLLQQRWAGGQEVTIEVLESGAIQMSWKVRGRQETVHVGLNVLDNRWHDVDLHRRLGALVLHVDNTSLVLATTAAASIESGRSGGNLRTYLLQESLQSNPSKAAELITVIGDEFTGCIVEGAGVDLSTISKVSGDVNLGTKCAQQFLESETCLGYGIEPCFSFICENGGTCRAAGDEAKCLCPRRYTGARCEVDQGLQCRPEFCLNHGTCQESSDGDIMYCSCKAGFYGKRCEKPAGPSRHCASAPCANGGRCHASEDNESYECTCQPGFTGKNCETKVNNCGSAPCRNNGSCVDAPLGYTCHCLKGFRGPNCEINRNECIEDYSPCNGRGRCFDRYGGFQCVCDKGFEGNQCERAVDRCAGGPCHHGGTCTATISGYYCQCTAGFTGENCEVSDCSRKPANKQCADPHAACDARSGKCHCKPGYVLNQGSCLPARSCLDAPCWNGGTCSGNGFAYTCLCPGLFGGRHCEYDQDSGKHSGRCDDALCANGGSCIQGSTNCTCVPGFAGPLCEINENNCEGHPCLNHGHCVDLVNDFICSCLPVPRGTPCTFHQCGANGKCIEQDGHAICECDAGFAGEHCDLARTSLVACRCQNGASCGDDGACHCPDGFYGVECEHVVDACDEAPCNNNGQCTSKGPNDFVCLCPQGYAGKMCELNTNDCAGVKCPGKQTCHDLLNGYECRCPEGWDGDACDMELNGCEPNPCFEGATCINRLGRHICHCPQGRAGENCTEIVSKCNPTLCLNGALCQDRNDSYQCFCLPGFAGEHCEVNFDECLSSPCQNGATCNDMINRFECFCAPGFTGRLCQIDIDECALQPCKNGALCNDRVGHYMCSCVPGYTGQNCETDIDECADQPCEHGRCIDLVNDFRCDCADTGFKGNRCETNIDDCVEMPCENGGMCEDGINEFTCHCNPGFVGKTCEVDVPECELNPCFDGATCLERSNRTLYAYNYLSLFPLYNESDAAGYICVCPNGFTGVHCETNIDDCVDHQCRNGSCIDEINGYRCKCHRGFEGEFCELEIDECERLIPCVHGSCQDLVGDYSCSCERGFGDKNCSTALVGCQKHGCSEHSKCDPFLDAEEQHQYRCLCDSGYVGRHCETGTTVSFQKLNSAWELQFSNRREDFSMSLFFRTSLRHVRVVGLNVLTEKDTFVGIHLGQLVVTQRYRDVLRLGSNLNDAEWKNFTLAISAHGRIEAFVGDFHGEVEGILLGGDVKSAVLGSADVSTAKYVDGYIGCMQQVRVNDELMIPSRQIEHLHGTSDICVRTPQCTHTLCQNRGECHDEWFSWSCLCRRPFYGELCEKSYPAATFGFMRNVSWVKILIEPEEAESISRSTDVSLFVMTRSSLGLLFYLGTEPTQQLQESYLAAVLEHSHLKVILKVDSTVYQMQVDSVKLNDGQQHFINVQRNQSALLVTVDKAMRSLPLNGGSLKATELHLGWMNTHKSETQKLVASAQMRAQDAARSVNISTSLDSSTSAPLTTHFTPLDQQPVQSSTGAPAITSTSTASPPTSTAGPLIVENTLALTRYKRQIEGVTDLTGNTPRLKGVLQDVRVGDRHVPFKLQDAGGLWFGKALERHNVIEGQMGDPVCDSNPCQNGGSCVDIFNAFECRCTEDFRGPLCEELKPCRKYLCPGSSKCQDLVDGFECVANASFEGRTTLEYRASLDANAIANATSLELKVILESAADLLQISSPGQLLRVGVSPEGRVRLNANGQTVDVGEQPVTDGQWHHFKLTSRAPNKLEMDVDNMKTEIQLTLPLSFGSTLEEIRLGERLKGALGEVRIGGILLPFFEDSQLSNSTAKNKFIMVGSARPTIGLVLCWEGDCDNGGKCREPTLSFRCECKAGWQGTNCQENVDECTHLSEPCLNGGSCRDTVGSYQCVCPEGFEGARCEERIFYCRSSPCRNGATCEDTAPGNFSCLCSHDWDGPLCQERRIIDCYNSVPCLNGGTCANRTPVEDTAIAYECACSPGFEGRDCEIPKNFCKAQPCLNGGHCQSLNHEATFKCVCQKGYGGHICDFEIDYCLVDGCENSATCTKHLGGRTCNCSGTGFKGERCEQDIDECLLKKCLNGGTCKNLRGSFECRCPPDFFGQTCAYNNTCFDQNPCENGGTCVPFEDNDLKFVCSCPEGFTGQRCEDQRTALSSSDVRLIVGLSAACVLLLCFIVAVGLFLRVAKRKRATRGTYSPSRQEIYGSRVEMAHVIKPPPEERLI
ncbi:protein crumbs-like isoform X3 [Varroa destructor]|uniref:Protein crumbs n=1 Tax=Varroa destructor TaxID=109461 RepID=A0A7M7KSD5_VARDE|nr:protein crumbs-like isoform X3 [Varroa destructor]